MSNKEQTKKLNKVILYNSEKYYNKKPHVCAYHNWLARMYAYHVKGRAVYPTPKKAEIQAYLNNGGHKNKRRLNFGKSNNK